MDISNFLDWQTLFVNELFGSVELFAIGGILFVILASLKYDIPIKPASLLIGLFTCILFYDLGLTIPFILFLLFGAGMAYMGVMKFISKGG